MKKNITFWKLHTVSFPQQIPIPIKLCGWIDVSPGRFLGVFSLGAACGRRRCAAGMDSQHVLLLNRPGTPSWRTWTGDHWSKHNMQRQLLLPILRFLITTQLLILYLTIILLLLVYNCHYSYCHYLITIQSILKTELQSWEVTTLIRNAIRIRLYLYANCAGCIERIQTQSKTSACSQS